MVNKKFLIVTRVPKITALVAPFDANTFNDRNCWNDTWLAGTELLIFACKPTENAYLRKWWHMP